MTQTTTQTTPPDDKSDDTAATGPEMPHDGPVPRTWEDDETGATLFLRAAFTLLAGGLLAWAQCNANFNPVGAQWNRWVALSIVANFLLPLGIVWMFFGQGLLRAEWLKDQKYNAWSYGWDFRDWRTHFKWALAMFILVLPVLWFASRDPREVNYYRSDAFHFGYLPRVDDAASLLWLLGSLTVYMFCWEWFHRGFLLFGIAQGVGPVPAIVLQAIVFALTHAGKYGPEAPAALVAGLALGTVCWRQKSFAPAFYTHALVHLAWAVLILF